MELRFLRTFVLFGDSSLDEFYDKMSLNILMFESLAGSVFNEHESSMAKYNMVSLTDCLVDEMTSYLSLKNVGMVTEIEKMFEYLFTHLNDLPKYHSYLLLPLMSDYNILRQVFRHLGDFYPILIANKTTTQYIHPRYQFIVDRVKQFCFECWTFLIGEASQCSSIITSILLHIIPLELEVLCISTSKIIKESTSTQLEQFVKQILKASPRIIQNYLYLLQGRMEGVDYAPTQSNVMIEFLLIFLTDITKLFFHHDKLNDMLAHAGLLTRKISILLEESSENNIDEADFAAPDLLQEIERMKRDIRKKFLKASELSQHGFPMDDGFLFMNLLLKHLNDLLISNSYSVALIKKEIGMAKESLEFLRSSFGKVRQALDDSSGVVKDCWVRALDVAYEAEHVISSILVRDNALSHLIFSLPRVTDKIKLIVADVTSLQLKDNNGDDVLDTKSSIEPIESTSSSSIKVTVGHEEDEARIIGQLLDEHESELDMMKVMQLSYDHLPYLLKPLLLYFARSQKSIGTPVSTLMQLWVAEGSLIMVDHIPTGSIWMSEKIKVCYMHDVVHDFCSVKAEKEKFLKLINSGDPSHASDFLHRRLTIHTDDSQLHKKCVLLNSDKSSAGSKHLISLKVSGFPDDSRYICHTRHLRLTYNVKSIPLSWLNLQNLETLLISEQFSTIVLLPRLFKLSKLKHVSIDQSSFIEEDADQSRILEAENSKLTNLSHVDISYSQGTNDALAKFPNLQHLDCTIMVPKCPPTHGNWFPKFDVLNKLQSMLIGYHNAWDYYGYPIEYHFPTSLKELRLYAFPVTAALLSAIAALPQLGILAIMDSYFVDNKWDAKWEVDRETFPKLEELILAHCKELTEIPSGFWDIETLKSIRVLQRKHELGDSAIETKKQIVDFAGEDRLHVHISSTYLASGDEEEFYGPFKDH
ncbi:hypothetical protein H5410_019741 [Solanum commersonii]|uniref:Uncharacterized protein n=1 Tax=Solanum commersonii TaxID=4109 RepID=A0A9J5ZAF2_SOLCO|nr:hypothetical protein H5410_019741 [Solanum commersonii]